MKEWGKREGDRRGEEGWERGGEGEREGGDRKGRGREEDAWGEERKGEKRQEKPVHYTACFLLSSKYYLIHG